MVYKWVNLNAQHHKSTNSPAIGQYPQKGRFDFSPRLSSSSFLHLFLHCFAPAISTWEQLSKMQTSRSSRRDLQENNFKNISFAKPKQKNGPKSRRVGSKKKRDDAPQILAHYTPLFLWRFYPFNINSRPRTHTHTHTHSDREIHEQTHIQIQPLRVKWRTKKSPIENRIRQPLATVPR